MSSAVDVHLAYRREGDLSTGCVYLLGADGDVSERSVFTRVTFGDMLLCAARVLEIATPSTADLTRVRVVLHRTDHAGLVPYALDAATVDLLRHDPLAAIEAMTCAGSPSLATERVRAERAPAPPVLRAGTDALADSFGDCVWVRVRGAQLECPGCGLWGTYASPALVEARGDVLKVVFQCAKRCKARTIIACQARWGSVRVDDLLRTALPRFYLPRAWNPEGPWISRETLMRTYEEYLVEKEKASCSTSMDR
jgi:hypothetical protein